jgi:predicted house-cleaning noncanonical NTP pyrophosphatase (MazG superfamily)
MSSNRSLRQTPSTKRATKLPERELAPVNSITSIQPSGIVTLSKEMIQPMLVGWKAFGLSSVPNEWVPKFLVVHADCLKDEESKQGLSGLLKEGIAKAGIATSIVKVRSSGTGETIQYRGRLKSATCSLDEIAATISDCAAESANSIPGEIHWVVQEFVQPQRQGHLSNKRRVSKEKRDWVAELELKDEAPGYSTRIAVRRWRDGDRISDVSLSCGSELEISFCLKRVALWAERLASRMHFEWVWNGKSIRVVQADIADPQGGVDPTSLVADKVPRILIQDLRTFKKATTPQFRSYTKLRNAWLYQQLGYTMPFFYVLDDAGVIAKILNGIIPDEVERDLEELTKRPLILRTDGTKIQKDKLEMLPRSDELRSVSEAKAWLIDFFKPKIEKGCLQQANIALIGHHFIPSLASAWARAEPGTRIVRIEALWGLPEGLYWYSHDTYEIDTQQVVIKPKKKDTVLTYTVGERLRYKGNFVAPDKMGKWVPYETMAPFDWRPAINKRSWLFEIAQTTRLISERQKYPVAVMWFIGNHPDATQHSVLPWFHNRSDLELAPKAAPRRKFTSSATFTIQSNSDWEELKLQVGRGKRVELVTVKPTDCELIRNPDFTQNLADFAGTNGIIIELAGGVLTHAYDILHRQGAQVVCTDLFGADEDVVDYNKLVRDKIPSMIKARGEKVDVIRLSGDALTSALCQKLVEEALEALDTKSGDDLIGELADIEEVISGLLSALKIGKKQINRELVDKERRRGGFLHGYMLIKTSTPHSLQKPPNLASATLGLADKPRKLVISNPADIPATPTYRRPDLRQIEEDVEKLFVFETEIKRGTNLLETVNFTLPIHGAGPKEFSLTIEIRRNKASLRTSARLRLRPSQLMMDFPESQLTLDFPDSGRAK